MEKVCEENILSLDTASRNTGYAIYKDGKLLDTGVWRLKGKTKYWDLYKHITETITKYGISLILAEDIYKDKSKAYAYDILCECRGIVELCAQQMGLQETKFISAMRVKNTIWGYNPKRYQLHRDFTRSKQKGIMIDAIAKLGYMSPNNTNDDEADAIALLIAYFKIWHYKLPLVG